MLHVYDIKSRPLAQVWRWSAGATSAKHIFGTNFLLLFFPYLFCVLFESAPVPLLNMYPKKLKPVHQREMGTPLFISALLILIKT